MLRYFFPRAPEGDAGAGAPGGTEGNPEVGAEAGEEGTGQPGRAQKPPSDAGLPKKYRLKVDNREEEVDETELVKRAQLGTAAHRRMQKAAEIERQKAQFDEKVKTPQGALELFRQNTGKYTPEQKEQLRQSLEDFYDQEFIKPGAMSPEQKRIAELEAKEKARQDADKEAEETTKAEQQKKLLSHHKAKLSEFVRATLTEGKIPADEDNVRLAAHEITLLRKAGLPVDPKSVAAEVNRRIQARNERQYANATDDELEAMFSPVLLKRLLKLSIGLHKKRSAAPAPQVTEQDPEAAKAAGGKSGKYIPMNSWLKNRR